MTSLVITPNFRDDFKRCFSETRYWCSRPKALNARLRTLALEPFALRMARKQMQSVNPADPALFRQANPLENLETTTTELFAYRRKLIATIEVETASIRQGKFLALRASTPPAPAASEASEGFVDPAGLPPWDTWVWWHGGGEPLLVAWIPQIFWPFADRAIEADTNQSLFWIDVQQP